ncbi:hypothetical protein AGMMS4952_12690 [Spirochaetia bacterium]|nr:hypothetical protein AGMMS4952_12690 [Spirochaetia bacterium]
MKRFMALLAITLFVVGMVSAQQWGNRGRSQSITVNGTLQLQNGTIAVINGGTIYYVPTLERYIGFIEELKEGAQVNLEGYIMGNSNYVQPSKVTINGKSYDFTANAPQGNPYNGYGRGYVGQRSCCWDW